MATGGWSSPEHSCITAGRHSVVVNQEELDQRFLQCTVCYDKFDQRSHVPKLLPACNHTFCQACIQQLLNTARPIPTALTSGYMRYVSGSRTPSIQYAYAIICPNCRQQSHSPTKNAQSLQTDYKLVDLMEFFQGRGMKSESLCDKHNQPLNFFCEQCVLPICRDCTVIAHKEKDGHSFLDIQDAFHRFEPELKTQAQDMRSTIQKIECQEEHLQGALQTLSSKHEDAENHIDSFIDDCVSVLEDRRNQLKSMLSDLVAHEQEKRQSELRELSGKRRNLQRKAGYLDGELSYSNMMEAFAAHKELRESLPQLDEAPMTTETEHINFDRFQEQEYQNIVQDLGRIELSQVHEDLPSTSQHAEMSYIPKSESEEESLHYSFHEEEVRVVREQAI